MTDSFFSFILFTISIVAFTVIAFSLLINFSLKHFFKNTNSSDLVEKILLKINEYFLMICLIFLFIVIYAFIITDFLRG